VIKYGYKREVAVPYSAAIEKVTAELKKEGFGIPSRIDVRALLKEKLNVDFDNYVILGACNPPFAYQALQAEADIGLMMPCNVIVYEKAGKTYIASILPTLSMSMTGNEKLRDIASQVEQKLKKVIDNI
jgi:uncharacterized protein (DUF302 family)